MTKWFPPGNKYHNQPTKYNGRTYHSKAEADYAKNLDLMKKAGMVIEWIPQPKFVLSRIRYTADFLVVWSDGTVTVDDVKGKETQRTRDVRKLWPAHVNLPLRFIWSRGEPEVILPEVST